jgi:hypothetical protein
MSPGFGQGLFMGISRKGGVKDEASIVAFDVAAIVGRSKSSTIPTLLAKTHSLLFGLRQRPRKIGKCGLS